MIVKHRKLLKRLNSTGRPYEIDCQFVEGRWVFWRNGMVITSTPITKQAENVLKSIIVDLERKEKTECQSPITRWPRLPPASSVS